VIHPSGTVQYRIHHPLSGGELEDELQDQRFLDGDSSEIRCIGKTRKITDFHGLFDESSSAIDEIIVCLMTR
jgi:hypothetical protein